MDSIIARAVADGVMTEKQAKRLAPSIYAYRDWLAGLEEEFCEELETPLIEAMARYIAWTQCPGRVQ